MHTKFQSGILLILIFIFGSCQTSHDNKEQQSKETLIAISKYYPKLDYQVWLSDLDMDLKYVEIYSLDNDSIVFYLQKCNGLILTGGKDVDPIAYGKEEERHRCGKFDARRDSLEMLMVQYAFESQKPLLGVCRGMQLLNVAKGGSLIIDLPNDRNTNIHQLESTESYHAISINEKSVLNRILKTDSAWVNSNHHQAVNRLADGFEITAYAPDSIAESIWWTDTLSHPYVLGVQWHPERLGKDNHTSALLANSFLQAISDSYHQN